MAQWPRSSVVSHPRIALVGKLRFENVQTRKPNRRPPQNIAAPDVAVASATGTSERSGPSHLTPLPNCSSMFPIASPAARTLGSRNAVATRRWQGGTGDRREQEEKVAHAKILEERFPDLDPCIGDLFLFEAHQIAALPVRAPARELAAVLHAHPQVHRFFVARQPAVDGFLASVLAQHEPVDAEELATCEASLLWELADWIIYERDPARLDESSDFDAGLSAIADVVELHDKVVIDAGAGTGRVTFAVGPVVRHVFAVEPVAALRRFMCERAEQLGLDNVYVVDGFLHDIPLPPASADVLLTRQAIGWHLAAELAEIERVVSTGGTALHLVGMPYPAPRDDELHAALLAADYESGLYVERGADKRRYWKEFRS